MVKAYLSHRRENDGMSHFSRSLIDWAHGNGIELQVDCKDAELSRPIDEFVSKLETSSSVVFLLNRRFFLSPWCMGELYEFLARRNANYHGFFIACDNFLNHKELQQFFDDFKKSLINHWREVAHHKNSKDAKEEALTFVDHIPEMIGIIRRLNLPDEKQISENQGEAVWKQIKDQRERAKSSYTPVCADSFEEECKNRLIERLKNSRLLSQKIAGIIGADNEYLDVEEIVNNIWKHDNRDRLSHYYRGLQDALNDCEKEHKEKIKKEGLEILSILLLAYIDRENRDKILQSKYGMCDHESIRIAESDPVIAEMVLGSAEPTLFINFTYNKNRNRLEVNDRRYYGGDKVQREVTFSCNSIFDAELIIIWNYNFPNEEKNDDSYLSEKEIKRLGNRLEQNFKRGKARYYLVPVNKPGHPLVQPGVTESLKYILPYLFVLRTGVVGQPSFLSADFEEYTILDELENFATLLKPEKD